MQDPKKQNFQSDRFLNKNVFLYLTRNGQKKIKTKFSKWSQKSLGDMSKTIEWFYKKNYFVLA